MSDEAVKALALKNADGDDMTYVSHSPLGDDRKRVFASAFPDCAEPNKVIAIVAKGPSGETKELAAVIKGSEPPQLIFGSCGITFDDLIPADCIEYAFPETGQWTMAQLSRDALEMYRGMKFDTWKKMLLEPTCEAAFRRMLQIGIITQLYDPHVFPTPEELKARYQVTDDKTGKLITLPHPVAALRVWDAEKQAYESIDSHLTGAPTASEKDTWWANFVKELTEKHGEEYINGLQK